MEKENEIIEAIRDVLQIALLNRKKLMAIEQALTAKGLLSQAELAAANNALTPRFAQISTAVQAGDPLQHAQAFLQQFENH